MIGSPTLAIPNIIRMRVVICLVLLRLIAAEAVFYVNSLQGDDSNSGESSELAFQTIFKCAKAIAKNEDEEDCTCLIAQGVYREEVAVPEAARDCHPAFGVHFFHWQ